MKSNVAVNAQIDWTNLAQVIQLAESIGAGYTVFRYSNEGDRYGICKSADLPLNNMVTGRIIGEIGYGIFVVPQKVFVMYRTKRRVLI